MNRRNAAAFAARGANARFISRDLRGTRVMTRGDLRGGRFAANRGAVAPFGPSMRRVGAPLAAATVGASFASRQKAHAGWYHNWRRHRAGFGWYGPVFWPYAYDSILGGAFWPYAYDYDPFWDYGYGGIYTALFYPHSYEELIDVPLPRGSAGRRTASLAPGENSSTRALQRLAPVCGSDAQEVAGIPIDEIQAAVQPTDAQRAMLDEAGNAAVRAAQIVKAACPSQIALTPTGRIASMQDRIQAMIEAVAIVRGPLEKFYDSLSDEQKARFDAIVQRAEKNAAKPQSLMAKCNITEATNWPTAQIERAVRPTADQQTALDALKRAAEGAAENLKSSCPAELPVTPSARFSAIAARLKAMLDAVKSVRDPLDTFYGSLSNEQKAQFNMIGRSRSFHQG